MEMRGAWRRNPYATVCSCWVTGQGFPATVTTSMVRSTPAPNMRMTCSLNWFEYIVCIVLITVLFPPHRVRLRLYSPLGYATTRPVYLQTAGG